jgi:hypothetical protein
MDFEASKAFAADADARTGFWDPPCVAMMKAAI